MSVLGPHFQMLEQKNGYIPATKCPPIVQTPSSYDDILNMAKILRSKISLSPDIGIVCGSGLGQLCDKIEGKELVPYADIPGLPVSTVHGHAGNFVVGYLRGKSVIAMQGRFHQYEGYSVQQCVIPIRMMYMLGVRTILLTNAAGSLNENYIPGDLVLIRDHISLPGMAGMGPLSGRNEDRFGPRFVTMLNAYDNDLGEVACRLAQSMGLKMQKGVYAMVAGPHYETPSECRFLKSLGADLVGMSTANEVIAARHCGMKVIAFSLVTNNWDLDCNNNGTNSADIGDLHADVLKKAHESSGKTSEFVARLIEHL